jgi:hypothetical protein
MTAINVAGNIIYARQRHRSKAMNLIDLLFRRQIEQRAQKHIAAMLIRYSENPFLLKLAWSAQNNLPLTGLAKMNTHDLDTILTPIARGIRAYGEGVIEVRSGKEPDDGGTDD